MKDEKLHGKVKDELKRQAACATAALKEAELEKKTAKRLKDTYGNSNSNSEEYCCLHIATPAKNAE